MSVLEERIANFAFAMSHGNVVLVSEWLAGLGCEITYEDDKELNVKGVTGMMCGMAIIDPVSCAIQLGFALAGMLWPKVYPGLLPVVREKWKAEMRWMKKNGYVRSDLLDPIVEVEIRSELFGYK